MCTRYVNLLLTRCARGAQTPPRPLQRRSLPSDNISHKMSYLVMLRNLKVILNPHPDSDKHQNWITSRGSPVAHTYHVWSPSANAFVSNPTYRITDRQTNSGNRTTPPRPLKSNYYALPLLTGYSGLVVEYRTRNWEWEVADSTLI